jgi:hypothetical protein
MRQRAFRFRETIHTARDFMRRTLSPIGGIMTLSG